MEKGEINFFVENDFDFQGKEKYKVWLEKAIFSEEKLVGDLNYIFCDDDYLHRINLDYLSHDTYTDIITFDYGIGNTLHGDIYISTERIAENAEEFKVKFETEFQRVMVHGILHLCGYGDKSERERELMRRKEEEKMELFHVEQ